MPLVAHIPLPTFDYLEQRGEKILKLGEALHQDIRELHIGFLNMMPDAVLGVTERQFLRLLGSSNQIAQFFVYPFTIPGLPRSPEAQAYIDQYYLSFDQLAQDGLDALIITGANVVNPALDQEPFWDPLQEIITWAQRACYVGALFVPGDTRDRAGLAWHRTTASATEALGGVLVSPHTG